MHCRSIPNGRFWPIADGGWRSPPYAHERHHLNNRFCSVLQHIKKSLRKPFILFNGIAYFFNKIHHSILADKFRADISEETMEFNKLL